MKTHQLTKEDFLKKVADFEQSPVSWNFLGERPCIVFFFTKWCKTCASISPIMDECTEKYKGQIDIYKVDAENEHELASAFGIRSIPTYLFCPMKDSLKVINGAMPREQFIELIDKILISNVFEAEGLV